MENTIRTLSSKYLLLYKVHEIIHSHRRSQMGRLCATGRAMEWSVSNVGAWSIMAGGLSVLGDVQWLSLSMGSRSCWSSQAVSSGPPFQRVMATGSTEPRLGERFEKEQGIPRLPANESSAVVLRTSSSAWDDRVDW